MLEKIYHKMPIWLQNLMISIYGFGLKKNRFGINYKKAFKEVNLESSIELEKNKINKFLKHASINVPYYSNYVKSSIDINEDLNQSIEKFPILTKDTLRYSSEQLLSIDCKDSLITVSTSGSTGSPLEIKMDGKSREINYAFFHKFLENIGVSEFERSVTFAGRIFISSNQSSPPYWRKNKAMNTLLMSSYHLSKGSCASYVEAIEDWNPYYIDSYPSAIYELALLMEEISYTPKVNLKAIVTSSETLFDYQREIIQKVFNCPIFDYYGCAEQSVLAFQTKSSNGDYIVPCQYCLVEILDESFCPVPSGQSGKIVCTNLFNSAAPIIRYDIGDKATAGEYYPGTRFLKTLKSIEGRTDDIIVTAKGNKVGRLDPVFKGLTGIKETQIVQDSFNLLTINLVASDSESIDEDKLIYMLHERVGKDMKIVINYVDSIPRTSSGKFRSVISKIKN